MILQAYDFLCLHRRYGCLLQMGGADQWGNIINGVDLVHKVEGHQAFGLTTPLITTSTGAKMGKSEKGAIWLSPDRLSPYEFWQFWRNTPDADVGRFLRLYTELPMVEVARLETLRGAELNEAKKILADAVTSLAHGEEALQAARLTALALFESGTQEALLGLTEVKVTQAVLNEGVPLVDLLVESGLAESKSEARRLIRSLGARINNDVISDEIRKITLHDFNVDHTLKLSAGKKRHALVRIE
jgi:tyrosyl-tRNA synthetase